MPQTHGPSRNFHIWELLEDLGRKIFPFMGASGKARFGGFFQRWELLENVNRASNFSLQWELLERHFLGKFLKNGRAVRKTQVKNVIAGSLWETTGDFFQGRASSELCHALSYKKIVDNRSVVRYNGCRKGE